MLDRALYDYAKAGEFRPVAVGDEILVTDGRERVVGAVIQFTDDWSHIIFEWGGAMFAVKTHYASIVGRAA
jgi:hypothetical protein